MAGRGGRFAAAAALALAAAAVPGGVSSAATTTAPFTWAPPKQCKVTGAAGTAAKVTCTYAFRAGWPGEPDVLDVPPTVTRATITARGGAGGSAYEGADSPAGGRGGVAKAAVTLDPAKDLEIWVGERGGDAEYNRAGEGGSYRGRAGATIPGQAWAGGGGGLSEVRVAGSSLRSAPFVLGGGGGGGSTGGAAGGAGGGWTKAGGGSGDSGPGGSPGGASYGPAGATFSRATSDGQGGQVTISFDMGALVGCTTGDWVPLSYRVVKGTSAADKLTGAAKAEAFYPGGGNDIVNAGGGDDVVCGGSGADTLAGGTGNDRVYGDAGKDKLSGEAGNDQLFGGDDGDQLYGGADADTLRGQGGGDGLHGGDGVDTLYGDDRLKRGFDVYDGGPGYDVYYLDAPGDGGNRFTEDEAGAKMVGG